jgi:hypothetical protein
VFAFVGRSLRFKNLRWHIRLVLAAMASDFVLVLGLVMFRDALSKVEMGMHWTLIIHIPIAISTLGLYVLTAHAGYSLYRGDESSRARLRILDKFLLTFRVLTLVTSLMFQMLRPPHF